MRPAYGFLFLKRATRLMIQTVGIGWKVRRSARRDYRVLDLRRLCRSVAGQRRRSAPRTEYFIGLDVAATIRTTRIEGFGRANPVEEGAAAHTEQIVGF